MSDNHQAFAEAPDRDSGPSLGGGNLAAALDALATFHGTPPSPPSTDAFELVLFENVAYLAPYHRRVEAFELLRETIGTSPRAVSEATEEALEAVTARGILKGTSAAKLRRCAELALTEFGGDLNHVVDDSTPVAKRALKRFPGIGDPGAEKILLFAADRPFLAPDSNGLRVLVRLGFVREGSSYAKTYAAARSAAAALGVDAARLRLAHGLLRLHGQTVCSRRAPACASCPLRGRCAYASTVEVEI